MFFDLPAQQMIECIPQKQNKWSNPLKDKEIPALAIPADDMIDQHNSIPKGCYKLYFDEDMY